MCPPSAIYKPLFNSVNFMDTIVKHLKAFKIPCKEDTDGQGNDIVTGTFQGRPFRVVYNDEPKIPEYHVFRGHTQPSPLGFVTSLSQLYKLVQTI